MSEYVNGVIIQAFHWFMPEPPHAGMSHWQFVAGEAAYWQRLGITAAWLPPPSKGDGGGYDVGYGVHDHFDLGEFDAQGTIATKYGTRDELHAAINALHGYDANLAPVHGATYIQVYADAVLNHKSGGDNDNSYWDAVRVEPNNRSDARDEPGYESGHIEIQSYTCFPHKERHGAHSSFVWHARHFDSVDTAAKIRQGGVEFSDAPGPKNSSRFIYRFTGNEQHYEPQVKPGFDRWVSLEKGNYDYLTGCDLDYSRHDVREEMKHWGRWLQSTAGFDGFRLDAVKHIDADYLREWIGDVRASAGRPLLCFGEWLSDDVSQLHGFLGRLSTTHPYPQDVSLLDFPLRFKFRNASYAGDSYDLAEWNRQTLVAEQPSKAVTFVECHDYEHGRDYDSHVREWIKPLAYAFILLRPQGYPVVFYPDLYGSAPKDEHAGQPAGREYLELLLRLRQQFALGEERFYGGGQQMGWIRMGGVPGARGAMAVVLSNGSGGVRSVRMDTGRVSRRFYHLATIKLGGGGFLVARNRYDLFGDKAEGLHTDGAGSADFLTEGGAVTIWLEDGVGLN
jgi:alpha-amylase